jgi:hypothetical protein
MGELCTSWQSIWGLGMFTVKGRPLLGMVMKVDRTSSSGSGSVKSHFESTIKPG